MNENSISPMTPISDNMSSYAIKENICKKTTRYTMNFELNLSAPNESELDKIKQFVNDILVLTQQSSINVDYFRQNSSTNSYCA